MFRRPGEKAARLRILGAGFKLFYHGVDSGGEKSVRVMRLKLERVIFSVVSGCALRVGCELKEEGEFKIEVNKVMQSIPRSERVVIGADASGHVGTGNSVDEEVMGGFGIEHMNAEGQMHRVTYTSGGKSTQVDYILCR